MHIVLELVREAVRCVRAPDGPGPPGRQGRCAAISKPQPDCTVMLTATAEVPPAADAPGPVEPQWAWRDAPIATLVWRIQQLQNERAQAFRRLDQNESTRRAGGVAGTSEAEQNMSVGVAWEKRGVARRGRNPQPEPLSSRSAKNEPALDSLQSVGFWFCSFELGGSPRWLGQGECSVSRGRGFSILPTRHRAHRQYMLSDQHHDFPLYRNVVHEVTQVFAAASREVLAVEAELAGPRAQPVLARHVRNLQELEQTRLATVALLQVMGTPGVSEQEDPEKLRQLKI
ncbi:hypothetical protein U0070_004286, partial [Myodes glareolus]